MAKPKETSKNWFARHKVLTAFIILFAIFIIIPSSKDGTTTNNSSKSSTTKTYKFTDRADKQATDVEVAVGEPATVDGVKMTVLSADRKPSLGQFDVAPEGKQYLVLNVQLENVSDKTHPYNKFNFKIQTSSGQVLDVGFTSTTNDLQGGDLVAGGKAVGTIVLEVPVESGHQYVIWKPNGGKPDRAIVEVQ